MASIDTAVISIDRKPEDRLGPVRIWLYVIAALVLLMVAVGGITRLTDSGLSITEWKPISGMLPPMSDADWQAEFEAYQRIPEYQLQNHWMSVDEFKFIFWWEWAHRFLGRVIGLVFAVPFLVFLVQRRFSWNLAAPLAGLFVLGGLQGALGWWMVSSGLTERVDVSQYRLAAHFAAAAVLFSALVWVARSLSPPAGEARGMPAGVFWLAVLVFIQLIAGAFVAGLDAGYAHNTWPLMDGALIPPGLGTLDPWWLNAFENITTVQFIHRMIAYGIVVYTGILLWQAARKVGFSGVNAWLPIIGLLVAVQVVLGIATLVLIVPLGLALAHQVVAFLLLGATVAYLSDFKQVSARYLNTEGVTS